MFVALFLISYLSFWLAKFVGVQHLIWNEKLPFVSKISYFDFFLSFSWFEKANFLCVFGKVFFFFIFAFNRRHCSTWSTFCIRYSTSASELESRFHSGEHGSLRRQEACLGPCAFHLLGRSSALLAFWLLSRSRKLMMAVVQMFLVDREKWADAFGWLPALDYIFIRIFFLNSNPWCYYLRY